MTTTAVALVGDAAPLAIQAGQELFTDKQRAALAALGIKDCPNAELAVFMHYCQRTQLDPFSRQIYYIKRREMAGGQWVDKWTTQVGIDGFRVIRDRVAARTGCTVEFEDTVWYDADGREHKAWLSPEPPAACKVVLVKYQDNRKLRYAGVLRTASYMAMKDGKPVSQWKTQPDHMIEKCCEAFATRRAFPNDFSGLYIPEELDSRAGDVPPAVRRVKAADIIVTRDGAEQIADRMGPSDHAVPPHAAAGQEATAPAATAAATAVKPVTAHEVNARFKALGFGVKDKDDVLAAAAAFCDRTEPVKALADLSAEELAGVMYRLSGCDTRDEVTELHALVIESRGEPDDAGARAAERAFKAGEAE